MKSRVKVGDKIRILVDQANCAAVEAGDIFFVTEVRKDRHGTFAVSRSPGDTSFFSSWLFDELCFEEESIELVEG